MNYPSNQLIKLNIRHIFFLSLSTILLLTSCKNPNEREKNPNNVLIIFQRPPTNSFFNLPSGGIIGNDVTSNNYFFFLNSNNVIEGWKNSKPIDTLVLPCNNRYVEVKHLYQGSELIYLSLMAGDTIIVTYNSLNYPTFTSKSSNKNTYHYNIWNVYIRENSIFNFNLFDIHKIAYFRLIYKNRNSEAFKMHYKNLINIDSLEKNINEQIPMKYKSLDSLYTHKAINIHYYTFYKNRLNESLTYIKGYNIKNTIFNDSLIFNISYHDKIISYLKSIKAPLIQTSNRTFPDFITVFDSLLIDPKIPTLTKNLATFYCLENIIENFSATDIETYINKYAKLADTLKLNHLTIKYSIDFSNKSSLLLSNFENNKLNLNDIFFENKGKYLYIDFWASWCAPCRASMPDANILREEYKGKDVVFLYFALNDKETDWKKAINDLGLNSNCENYFIKNPKTSKFIEEFNIRSVPRYMLFDKTGNLMHKNAPGPSGEEIRKLLNGLLEQ